VTLDVEDIGSILETLRHDGKIEVRGDKFKAIRIKPMRNPGAEIPCGSCPVSLLFQLYQEKKQQKKKLMNCHSQGFQVLHVRRTD